MAIMGLGLGAFLAGVVFTGYAAFLSDKSISFLTRKDVSNIFRLTLGGMFLTAFGACCIFTLLQPTVKEECEQYSICYELVETVAENTDYSRKEVLDFFIIVHDDMEAWDAIKMLDNSLTDEQVNAIMEISAMKQAD